MIPQRDHDPQIENHCTMERKIKYVCFYVFLFSLSLLPTSEDQTLAWLSTAPAEDILPEWHFLLWDVHVVPDEKSLRIFSLSISDNAAIEFGNRGQSISESQIKTF